MWGLVETTEFTTWILNCNTAKAYPFVGHQEKARKGPWAKQNFLLFLM